MRIAFGRTHGFYALALAAILTGPPCLVQVGFAAFPAPGTGCLSVDCHAGISPIRAHDSEMAGQIYEKGALVIRNGEGVVSSLEYNKVAIYAIEILRNQREELDALRNQVGSQQNALQAAQAKNTDHEDDVAALQQELTTLQGQASQASTSEAALSEEITALQSSSAEKSKPRAFQ